MTCEAFISLGEAVQVLAFGHLLDHTPTNAELAEPRGPHAWREQRVLLEAKPRRTAKETEQLNRLVELMDKLASEIALIESASARVFAAHVNEDLSLWGIPTRWDADGSISAERAVIPRDYFQEPRRVNWLGGRSDILPNVDLAARTGDPSYLARVANRGSWTDVQMLRRKFEAWAAGKGSVENARVVLLDDLMTGKRGRPSYMKIVVERADEVAGQRGDGLLKFKSKSDFSRYLAGWFNGLQRREVGEADPKTIVKSAAIASIWARRAKR